MSVAFDANVTLTVEVAFASNPLTESPTWTDVSAYARGMVIKWGRTHELDTMSASTLSITLDNSDGRFDPTYATGAYYPNVKPMKQIRVRATHNAVTYDLFRGFVESWPMVWPAMKDSVVTVDATDGFKLLNLNYQSTARPEEKTGVRIGALLDDVLWPSSWRTLATGEVACQASESSTTESVLGLCHLVANTETGLFFVDGSGKAVFQDRNHRYNQTVAATFGDDGAELRYANLVLDYDDTQIWNRIEINRQGGEAAIEEDSDSQTTYGKRTLKKHDLLNGSDNVNLGLARILLYRYKDPQVRAKSLVVTPRRDPANLWPVVLGLGVSDLLVVKRRPPAGNIISENVHVEGVTHSIDAASKQWVTTISLSKAGATVLTEDWLLGDSVMGILGVTTYISNQAFWTLEDAFYSRLDFTTTLQ
jgi:hypothetical protein